MIKVPVQGCVRRYRQGGMAWSIMWQLNHASLPSAPFATAPILAKR